MAEKDAFIENPEKNTVVGAATRNITKTFISPGLNRNPGIMQTAVIPCDTLIDSCEMLLSVLSASPKNHADILLGKFPADRFQKDVFCCMIIGFHSAIAFFWAEKIPVMRSGFRTIGDIAPKPMQKLHNLVLFFPGRQKLHAAV